MSEINYKSLSRERLEERLRNAERELGQLYKDRYETPATQKLERSMKEYFVDKRMLSYPDEDNDFFDRIFAGVLAFIQVNYWQNPYLPINIYPEQEIEKKWWEFWK